MHVSDIDFSFLYSLSSLYNAVTFSAACPVAILSGLDAKKGASAFSRIFYDCAEDKAAALLTMQERFGTGRDDIKRHFTLHTNIRNGFYDIDEGINVHNRERVTVAATELTNKVSEYCSLVAEHVKRLREKSFLDFPTCVSWHYFLIADDTRVAQKSFNPAQSYENALSEIQDIKSLALDVKNPQTEVWGVLGFLSTIKI